ncbi:MAG: Acetyltransferase [Promethearchaeota archaeon]|nr:MAG: Acetyltransferase [Candidatus Lokiarchaeota archaeon]
MFQPASLKGSSPTPIDERIRKKFYPLYVFIILLSFLPLSIFEYSYFILLWQENYYWIFFILLPANFFFGIYLLQISSLIVSGLFLLLVNIFHMPKEGTYKRNIEDPEYFYWNVRNIIKKWALDIVASNPFPWLKNRFSLRFFGIHIGKHCVCDNSFISSEFVSIGDNVILGMGTCIFSFGIEAEDFILKEIKISDDVLIGAKCTILPGTHIKEGATMAAHSYTQYEGLLEEDKVYKGHPAKEAD